MSGGSASGCRARLVFDAAYRAYDFGPEHPLTPRRMETGLALIDLAGLGPEDTERWALPAADERTLELVHRPEYVEAVKRLSLFADEPLMLGEAGHWGLGRGDTPAFPGMHEAAAAIAGGAAHALAGIVRGEADHAFHPAGGLHHALPDRASGFCIYNDAAVAIAALVDSQAARVLYLDFDAHHGDGVQVAFYDDPRVLTFSIHETGRHLFPGTGAVYELGRGAARGYSLNLPVEPFTDDGDWTEALDRLLPNLAETFRPDVVVSQHGCDSHAWDPLTHLRISTRAFAHQAALAHRLAHKLAGGRWLALGGGGYDWVRVVPRSWSIVWAEMSGRGLPAGLPASYVERYAEIGFEAGFAPMPATFLDDPSTWPPTPRHDGISRENHARVHTLEGLIAANPAVPGDPARIGDRAPDQHD